MRVAERRRENVDDSLDVRRGDGSTVSESIVRADTGPSVPNRHVATAELKSPETRTVPPWIETSASGSTARTTAELAS